MTDQEPSIEPQYPEAAGRSLTVKVGLIGPDDGLLARLVKLGPNAGLLADLVDSLMNQEGST